MEFATNVHELLNAFDARELSGDELDKYYYDGTMFARMGQVGGSPIERLYQECRQQSVGNSAFLLLGHRGCGKSTELNKLAEKLRAEGYLVSTVNCMESLDFNNSLYADILVLMCDALLGMAAGIGCDISPEIRKTIAGFWADADVSFSRERREEMEIGAGLSVKAPAVPILSDLLSLGLKVKDAIRFREDSVVVYRSRISRRIGEWISTVNRVADAISEKTEGKRPIIIFEDLDKLDQENGEHVFFDRTSSLTGYNFPLIYTFPIAQSYTAKYAELSHYFRQDFRFPMIKIETEQGEVFREGYQTIRSIVEKRAELSLFEGSGYFEDEDRCGESALYRIIQKTGGSLRDLFKVIRESSVLAKEKDAPFVGMEDVEIELVRLQSELTIRMESRHYPFLAEICHGKKRQIRDREMLLEMMQAGIVLEYNGRQWHNVHPLVRDFLEEEGLL